MKSLQAKIWDVRERPYKTPSYEVCWTTARQVLAETFRARGLADHYGSRLLRTSHDGGEFDLERPPRVHVRERGTLTWYELTLEYLVISGRMLRRTLGWGSETLTTVTMALPDDCQGRPSDDLLRKALRNSALVLPGPAHREFPTVITNTLHSLVEASHPRSEFGDVAVGPGPTAFGKVSSRIRRHARPVETPPTPLR